MSTGNTHPVAEQYLSDLKAAAKVLPRQQRHDLVTEIESHLAEVVHAASSEAEIRNLIDDLGSPHEVVDAARPSASSTRGNAGVTALALGIVALLAAFLIPLGLIVAVPAGITSIVLGRRTRTEAIASGTTDVAATVGVVLGVIALVIPVLLFVLLIGGRTSGGDSDSPVPVVEAPTTAP